MSGFGYDPLVGLTPGFIQTATNATRQFPGQDQRYQRLNGCVVPRWALRQLVYIALDYSYHLNNSDPCNQPMADTIHELAKAMAESILDA